MITKFLFNFMAHIEGIKRMIDSQLEEAKKDDIRKQKEIEGLFSSGRVHIIITGRVVGVSFRRFIVEKANSLSLTGFVRNIENSVEIVAEGSALDELVSAAKKGPSHAEIENVDVKWEKATGEFDSFEQL